MSDLFKYGFNYLLVMKRDGEGYPMGQLADPNSPVNGTVYPALVLDTGISFTAPQPTVETVSERGGGKLRKKKEIGISDYSDGEFVISSDSTELNAMANGSTEDTTTVTGWTQRASNANYTPAPSLMMVFISRVEDEDGNEAWVNRVLPNCQIRKNPESVTQDGGVNPNPVSYTIIVTNGTRGIDGRPFSSSGMGMQGDEDIYYEIETDNPLMVETYVDDGSTGSFTLTYKLAATTATGASGNSITDEGATLAVTSVNASTGAVSQDGASDAGDKIVVAYPILGTSYQAVS